MGRVAMGWRRKQEQKTEIPSLLSPHPTVGALTVESGYSFKPPHGTSSAQTLDIFFSLQHYPPSSSEGGGQWSRGKQSWLRNL